MGAREKEIISEITVSALESLPASLTGSLIKRSAYLLIAHLLRRAITLQLRV